MTHDRKPYAELMRWWHQHQARQLSHEADLIRNGVLQDIFALRRHLELSCQSQPNADAFGCEGHLTNLKRVYAALENLSHRLETPYLQDSLPLALQHALQPWQHRCPWQVTLPPTWEAEPVENTQLLTMFLTILVPLLTDTAPQPIHCLLTLEAIAGHKQLTLQAAYPESLSSARVAALSTSVTPILDTFQLLTQGEYKPDFQPARLDWRLRWPSQPASQPNEP
ncbi:MAG: hypothetical protein ACFCVD_03175 [Nodosilinea sp.]